MRYGPARVAAVRRASRHPCAPAPELARGWRRGIAPPPRQLLGGRGGRGLRRRMPRRSNDGAAAPASGPGAPWLPPPGHPPRQPASARPCRWRRRSQRFSSDHSPRVSRALSFGRRPQTGNQPAASRRPRAGFPAPGTTLVYRRSPSSATRRPGSPRCPRRQVSARTGAPDRMPARRGRSWLGVLGRFQGAGARVSGRKEGPEPRLSISRRYVVDTFYIVTFEHNKYPIVLSIWGKDRPQLFGDRLAL